MGKNINMILLLLPIIFVFYMLTKLYCLNHNYIVDYIVYDLRLGNEHLDNNTFNQFNCLTFKTFHVFNYLYENKF